MTCDMAGQDHVSSAGDGPGRRVHQGFPALAELKAVYVLHHDWFDKLDDLEAEGLDLHTWNTHTAPQRDIPSSRHTHTHTLREDLWAHRKDHAELLLQRLKTGAV